MRLDWRRLQGEGLGGPCGRRLGLDESRARLDSGQSVLGLGERAGRRVGGRRKARRSHSRRIRRREGPEARRVRCGLRAQLGEVKVGSGPVAHVHGLTQATLGVVAVEDDAVDQDRHGFHDNFDDAADQRPRLCVALARRNAT